MSKRETVQMMPNETENDDQSPQEDSALTDSTSDDINSPDFTEIPQSLRHLEFQLTINVNSSISQLEEAEQKCKQLILESDHVSAERKWLVRHLVELRLRLQERRDAENDERHPSNSDSITSKVVLGHHFKVKSLYCMLDAQQVYCDHCTSLIWVVFQASYLCEDCGYKCHHKCLDQIARVCPHVVVTERGGYITDICPEKGLPHQKYRCAECHITLVLKKTWIWARLCDYDGKYYCIACHWNSESVIPARVIHNWDFTARSVSQASAQLIKITLKRPLINLELLNPKLFRIVPQLAKVKKLRENLGSINKYLSVCRIAQEQRLAWKLIDRQYMIDSSELYSLQDLVDTQNGFLIEFLTKIENVFMQHVKEECELCQARGYHCEICTNMEVLYPFDAWCIACHKCHTVYHRTCWQKRGQPCPKCERIEKRKVTDLTDD